MMKIFGVQAHQVRFFNAATGAADQEADEKAQAEALEQQVRF